LIISISPPRNSSTSTSDNYSTSLYQYILDTSCFMHAIWHISGVTHMRFHFALSTRPDLLSHFGPH
ncbi:hypothetical protein N7449_012196, partial [Penicillium cf. viridicatum]